ncbi:MAG: DNA polymerase Y family protein [Catonella sp.]|uniref:DNA polymerase Y family protein n=1 Tax=Catonella sp. TaxID=2382125 RepID=UPI003FA06F49
MDKLIFHVDVNSAFLSWTAVKKLKDEPESVDLRTIPSAIGGDVSKRHGVITACSIPAKKQGVKTGEPVMRALEKCPELQLFSSDFKTYREYSAQFIEILKKYALAVEQVSIDEAYLDMTGTTNPKAVADIIKKEIYENLGFTVNIGISQIKLLAKMASDFEKPYKVHTLFKEEIEGKMWKLPIEKLHGCGRKTSEKLRNIGVKTIGDVAALSKYLLCSLLGEKHGEYIYESSNGRGSDIVSSIKEVAKSYSNETTLPSDIRFSTYNAKMPKTIKGLAESVSKRLKKDGAEGYTISVSAKMSSFKRKSKQTTLSDATDDARVIEKVALVLMKELCFGEKGLFAEDEGIRLVGVGVSHLAQKECKQLDIFSYMREKDAQDEVRMKEKKKQEKTDKLAVMLNKINEKYGEGKVRKGEIL